MAYVTKQLCKVMVDKNIWKRSTCEICKNKINRSTDQYCTRIIAEGKND
jgi:hypothetical protein